MPKSQNERSKFQNPALWLVSHSNLEILSSPWYNDGSWLLKVDFSLEHSICHLNFTYRIFLESLFGSTVLLFSSFLNGFTIFSSVRMTNPWIHGLLSFSFQMGSSTQPPSQTFREAIPWFIRSPWGRCKLIQNISTVSSRIIDCT